MQHEWLIRAATPEDLAAAKNLLASAGLPTADLTAAHMATFLVAERAGEALAIVGLQQLGDIGLLRSLVVAPTCRGSGLGQQLVEALESIARQGQLRELWLLTIDADEFFARRGYTSKAREDAPQAIQNTAEFTQLCPGDAVLMCKDLR